MAYYKNIHLINNLLLIGLMNHINREIRESATEQGLTLPTSVDNIFSSWSHQAGYPLLTVTRNYAAGTFTITQKRYVANATDGNTATWYVPINFATASNPDYRNTKASHYLLNVTETVISDSQIASDDWLLLNIQNAFYYRTLYDTQNYGLITAVLKSQPWKIHPRNRAQLLYDAYIFLTTDRVSHSILLELLSYLENEDQYAPWSTANTILTVYDRYLRGDDAYYNFQTFVQKLIDPIFVKIGVNEIPGEHYLNNYLRIVLVSLACQVGSVECYSQSATKLSEYLYNGTAIEATLRTQAYCAGLRSTTNVVYQRVESDLLASTDATDRSLFISSLGCSGQTTQLNEFFSLSLDTTNSLSYSERTSLLNSGYSRSEIGVTASLEFLETSWEAYAKLSQTTSKPLDLALRGIATYVVSEKQKTRCGDM
uniref:Aminopeptidase N n=1 Tax=Drosophila rhopaloa TaxID=1041015 RepID=A0A6P4EZ32_DRORH